MSSACWGDQDRVIGRRARGASTITQQLVGNMHPDVVDRRDMSLDRQASRAGRGAPRWSVTTPKPDSSRPISIRSLRARVVRRRCGRAPLFREERRRTDARRGGDACRASTFGAVLRPDPDPDRARKRRDLVLRLMADQELITPAASPKRVRQPLVTVAATTVAGAAYFVDAVRVAATREGVPVDAGGYRSLRDARSAAPTGGGHGTWPKAPRRWGAAWVTPSDTGVAPKGATTICRGRRRARSRHGRRARVGRWSELRRLAFDRALFAVRQPGSAFKPVV